MKWKIVVQFRPKTPKKSSGCEFNLQIRVSVPSLVVFMKKGGTFFRWFSVRDINEPSTDNVVCLYGHSFMIYSLQNGRRQPPPRSLSGPQESSHRSSIVLNAPQRMGKEFRVCFVVCNFKRARNFRTLRPATTCSGIIESPQQTVKYQAKCRIGHGYSVGGQNRTGFCGSHVSGMI